MITLDKTEATLRDGLRLSSSVISNKNIQMKINFTSTVSEKDSRSLQELNQLIKNEADLETNSTMMKIEGAKADALIALEIISISLTAISTLITVLDYWKSKNPKYSITYNVNGNSFTQENISKIEFEKEMQKSNVIISIDNSLDSH